MSETRDKMKRIGTPDSGRICDECKEVHDIIYDMPVTFPCHTWMNLCESCRLKNRQVYVSYGYILISDKIDPKTLLSLPPNNKPDKEYEPTEEDMMEYEKEVDIDDELLGIMPDDYESDVHKLMTGPRIPFDR